MENKYSRGKIYRIDVGKDFYIGSTSKKYLCQRKGAHSESLKKGDPMILYVKMRELGLDFTMVELTIVKNFPCHSKKELEEEEGQVQRKLKPTLNSRIAGRTPEQYYLDNKEEFKDKNKQNHLKNKERNNERAREYHHEHKEELNEKSRLYKINNQEKIAELNRNTNERRKKEKGVCQYCHKEMSLYHLRYNHLKTCPDRPSSSS